MSYEKIPNLYADQAVLLFKEVYALEKIDGTSSHVTWKAGALRFFSGGAKHVNFVACFDEAALNDAFRALGYDSVVVYGEAYGGNLQGMSKTYGHALRFVVFEVCIDGLWLAVPQAADVATKLGLEFVDYTLVPATVEALDVERDRSSMQAVRNGCGNNKTREGVVIRPVIEVTRNNGARIIAKHKSDTFRETRTPRVVGDRAEALVRAEAIAFEWVTPMRLQHVVDKLQAQLQRSVGINDTGAVINAVVADVLIESTGEIVDSREARKAIGTAAAKMFVKRLRGAVASC